MAKRIGMIGNGHVGSALARGLTRAGHEVRAVGDDPDAVRDTAEWAQVVFLAVPFAAVAAAADAAGRGLDGKPVVDVTNAIGPDRQLAVGFTTSGAEELQRRVPRARVVKAFNTVFAARMEDGRAGGENLSVFAAGDDEDARRQVLELARDIGFDAVDAGPLRSARLLEPMAMFNIQLGYGLGLGTDIGLRLVRASEVRART